MKYDDYAPSLAVQAHCTQNLYEPSEKYPNAIPQDTNFPRHDTFQNGIIPNGQPTTFYTAATNTDIENIRNGQSNLSGFLSDQETVDSCKNENGIFDANEYADKTQTKPWRPDNSPSDTEYMYRENMAAFNVNWDKLNSPENADLREQLCDSEGNLRCAYGKAEENTHWGTGGGNQYYFNRDHFNEGVNRGIFEYDDGKTLKEDTGTLTRMGVSEDDYDTMNYNRGRNIDTELASCSDPNATSDIAKAHSLNEITPEKAAEINSAQAPEGNYLAKPDPAYNYGESTDAPNTDGIKQSSPSDKVSDGGGARAPDQQSGELPPQAPATTTSETDTISGKLPPQNNHSKEAKGDGISGTLPPQNASPALKEPENHVSGQLPPHEQPPSLESGNRAVAQLPETTQPTANNSQGNDTLGDSVAKNLNNGQPEQPPISGELPPQEKNPPSNDRQISGTLPGQAEGIDLPGREDKGVSGKDLAEGAEKQTKNGIDAANGIT